MSAKKKSPPKERCFQAIQLEGEKYVRENSSLVALPTGFVCSNWTIRATNKAQAKKTLAKLWDKVESGRAEAEEAARAKVEAAEEEKNRLAMLDKQAPIEHPSAWERFKNLAYRLGF